MIKRERKRNWIEAT